MADWRVPGIGNASWLIYVLAGLTVLSGLFVGVTTISLMRNAADERLWVQLATNIQVDSQRMSKASVEAALGNLDAFGSLSTVYQRIDQAMRLLRTGSPDGEIKPAPQNAPEVSATLSRLAGTWQGISRNAMIIVEADGLINGLSDAAVTFLTAVPTLQQGTDRMIRQLIESGAPSQQVFAASRQLVLADRMQRRINEILQSPNNTEQSAAQLREESEAFAQMDQALTRGSQRLGITRVINPQARATLLEVSRGFRDASPALEVVLRATDNLAEVRNASDSIYLDSDILFTQAGEFAQAVDALPRTRLWPSSRANSLGLLILILLSSALVLVVIYNARRRADTAFRSNRRTQQAIVRLLDELSSLAEGDLTAHASVTDSATGAIADAVNYAVEQLRELVIGINNTSRAVSESAESTRIATSDLAVSATEQAGQVARATEKIESMSSAFHTMAQRSRDSSETALQSVDMAHEGAQKVRRTISGMDTIREQIQETAKRIKRLGESTQEIGDIVGLINDIAEQTNVLALNAAIQAASSGGQGQGFAVVADEVQQLAERVASATRRISTLVQTIQLDTAEAIKSMEATTSEVVNGARLAQDAGSALTQIEQASTELSALIQEIARESDAHSKQAQRISELMDGIREVSVKTSRGTSQTADAVRELAELLLELQESVAHFKLPGSGNVQPSKKPKEAKATPDDQQLRSGAGG